MHQRFLRIAATSCAVLLSTLLPTTSSQAFGGPIASLGFDVKAGLDSATINFLNNYPATVREEAVKGANQILNRADESVSKIFDQSRDLVLLAKDVAVCAGVTLETVGVGTFRRMFGIHPNWTERLKEFVADIQDEATLTSTPADLYKQYVDADNRGRDAYCLTHQGDLDQEGIMNLRKQIKTTALMWQRLQPYCANVRECYALVSATVDTAVKGAAKQDLKRIDAEDRLAKIKRPPEPQRSVFSSNFDLRTYELALLALLSIHDDLIRASELRIAAGTVEKNKLDNQLATNEAKLNLLEHDKNKIAACNEAYKVAGWFDAAGAQLKVVEGYEVLTADELNALAEKVKNQSQRRARVAAFSMDGVINNGKGCRLLIIRDPHPGPV
ncbi:TPA: hypothetical protein NNM78_002223 [Pseudomonas aeruginosa]|nr:hypothetical protein [Pseudomonas aeruginosa]